MKPEFDLFGIPPIKTFKIKVRIKSVEIAVPSDIDLEDLDLIL
jgi:hypothetical protein